MGRNSPVSMHSQCPGGNGVFTFIVESTPVTAFPFFNAAHFRASWLPFKVFI